MKSGSRASESSGHSSVNIFKLCLSSSSVSLSDDVEDDDDAAADELDAGKTWRTARLRAVDNTCVRAEEFIVKLDIRTEYAMRHAGAGLGRRNTRKTIGSSARNLASEQTLP